MEQDDFLVAMARRYCWDMPDPASGAAKTPERVVRRVMDFGVLEDALALEPTLGRRRLVEILTRSPAGAMRPRSWWFWHYKLGLADAANDPPPMPVRTYGEVACALSSYATSSHWKKAPVRAMDHLPETDAADDALGQKLHVLLQSVEAKDHRDIAAMLRAGQSLEKGLAASAARFANFPPCEALKALVYFDDGNLADLSSADRAELIVNAGNVTLRPPLAILSHRLDR